MSDFFVIPNMPNTADSFDLLASVDAVNAEAQGQKALHNQKILVNTYQRAETKVNRRLGEMIRAAEVYRGTVRQLQLEQLQFCYFAETLEVRALGMLGTYEIEEIFDQLGVSRGLCTVKCIDVPADYKPSAELQQKVLGRVVWPD